MEKQNGAEVETLFIEISNCAGEEVKLILPADGGDIFFGFDYQSLKKLFVISYAPPAYCFEKDVIGRISVSVFTKNYKKLFYRAIEQINYHGLTVYRVGTQTLGEEKAFPDEQQAIKNVLGDLKMFLAKGEM